jgi:hypothetical protein
MLPNPVVRTVARVQIITALLLLGGIGAATVTARVAAADGSSCVDTCVSAFGVSFTNSRGDYFLLKDCATSEMTGTTYCIYSRLLA